MSKLSFRARALDATKPMPIYLMEEVPDLPDFAAINRAVPLMPTGMEKEEECEHHLQRAISAQQTYGHIGERVIPTPEVYAVGKDFLHLLCPSTYKLPRQLIHVQPFSMDQDIPDYDMDSDDEKWLTKQAATMDIKPLQFEQMMDRLEKSSGQQVITLGEAKILLKEDDDLIIAVYDYWLNKRLKMEHALIPQVRTEKRDGSTNSNPYVAFRRRTEKMQTRKNRKNDETSYEKMLKLKRDLVSASSLLELVRKREKMKREFLHLTVEIFEKRYAAGDFSGQLLSDLMAMKYPKTPVIPAQKSIIPMKQDAKLPKNKAIKSGVQKKRTYKRKSKSENSAMRVATPRADLNFHDIGSSDEEGQSTTQSDQEDENDPDGPYAFKRKNNCAYYAPLERLGNMPWCSREENGLADKRYRFCVTTVPSQRNLKCIGFARRRLARGGRFVFDRASTPLDSCWSDLDFSPNPPNGLQNSNELLSEIKNNWLWYKPQQLTVNRDSTRHSDQSDSDSDTETHRLVSAMNQPTSTKMPMHLNKALSNREELFEMQRKQLVRLKPEESTSESTACSEHSFTMQPTSKFTLNSPRVSFFLPTVITAEGTYLTSSGSAHLQNNSSSNQVSDSPNSIRSSRDRALVNGPVSDEPEVLIFNPQALLERLSGSSNKDSEELNNRQLLQTSVRLAVDSQSSSLLPVNFSLPSLAVPSTDHGSSSTTTTTSSHSSSDNIHLLHTKTPPQTELRFVDPEQNGNEVRLKTELFLSKIKVEKVDSSVSMDVT